VTDRNTLDSPQLGVELAAALCHLYPGKFQFGGTLGMVGCREVMQSLKCDVDPKNICQQWQARLNSFNRLRTKYLLY
jgi:hypothetical protein